MSILGIIPAKGHSNRLPDKNKLKINGRTLVEYTIDAAINGCIEDIILASDDDEILSLADKYGGIIQVMKRPQELSQDGKEVPDVVKYVIDNIDKKYDGYAILQPTSPLRTSQSIQKCVRTFLNCQYEFVYGATMIDSVKTVVPNGSIYIIRDENSWWSENSCAVILPEEECIDIDTPLDFKIAKVIMNDC